MRFLRFANLFNHLLPKIHCRPGDAKINGLHLVKTRRDSRSCKVSSGRPSPIGSISPPPTVISRYAACNSLTTMAKFRYSSVSMRQFEAISCISLRISRKCCNGLWMSVVRSGRFRGTCGSVMNLIKSELGQRDLLTRTQSARFKPLQYFL